MSVAEPSGDPGITDPTGSPNPTDETLVGVDLLGPCSATAICQDPNAVCINGTCLCHSSYYHKDTVCSKYGVCNMFYFKTVALCNFQLKLQIFLCVDMEHTKYLLSV